MSWNLLHPDAVILGGFRMTATTKILVVDDEPALCLLYQAVLQDEGYDVKTTTSAAQALNEMDKYHPDLVLMDIRMPGMDGIEAMGRMLNRKNDLPIVLNTAYSSYKDNFCTWLASAYVVKSSDLCELTTTIRKLLEESRAARLTSHAA